MMDAKTKRKTPPPPIPGPNAAIIKQAIRDYYFALDTRQHGDIAAHKAFSAIQEALGMEWTQGAEAKRRKRAAR